MTQIALMKTAASWELARILFAISLFHLGMHVYMTTIVRQIATAGRMFAYSPCLMRINAMIHSSVIQAAVITLDVTINAILVKSVDIMPPVYRKIVIKNKSIAILQRHSLYHHLLLLLLQSNKIPPLYLGIGYSRFLYWVLYFWLYFLLAL